MNFSNYQLLVYLLMVIACEPMEPDNNHEESEFILEWEAIAQYFKVPEEKKVNGKVQTVEWRRKIICRYCNLPLDTKLLCALHIIGCHPDEEIFICDECAKVFSDQYYFNRHKKNHENKFYCNAEGCVKKFETMQGLNRHQQNHAASEKKYSCAICKNKFATNSSKLEHERRLHNYCTMHEPHTFTQEQMQLHIQQQHQYKVLRSVKMLVPIEQAE